MNIIWEVEELACAVLGKNEEETEKIINDGSIDDLLWDKYEIDLEKYARIVEELLPFTVKVQDALTEKKYHAFVSGNKMLVKKEIE